MAYTLTEMTRVGTLKAEQARAVAQRAASPKKAKSPRSNAQSRFQPIEQILSRFETMESMFAAA